MPVPTIWTFSPSYMALKVTSSSLLHIPKKAEGDSLYDVMKSFKSPGFEKLKENLKRPPRIFVIPGLSSERSQAQIKKGIGFLGGGRFISRKWHNLGSTVIRVQDTDTLTPEDGHGLGIFRFRGTDQTEIIYVGDVAKMPEELWETGDTIKTAKAPYKTVEHNGWTILIGRSAADNDTLSLQIANPEDFWMHVSEYPGSHVVVRNPEGVDQLPEEVLFEAAKLSVQNSKAKGHLGVRVVVGKAGDLSKPEGSATGEITISNYTTVKLSRWKVRK